MAKVDYRDINGVQPKVGDKIAYAVGWGTRNAYLNTAVVTDIKETESRVRMTVRIINCGLYSFSANGIGKSREDKEAILQFPASHCKFVVL